MTASELQQVIALDAQGIIPGRSENIAEFLRRAEALTEYRRQLERTLRHFGEAEVLPGLTVQATDRIPEECLAEASELTERLYGFSAHWVPGFFLSHGVGWLWGGCCMIEPQVPRLVFLLRAAFRRRRTWLCYRRTELAAHEWCHAARYALNDSALEEFFAYRTSKSALRRYLGNCFIFPYDAVLFIVPAMMLPAAQLVRMCWFAALPLWPFYLLAAAYPLFLLFRNWRSRKIVFRAWQVLQQHGIERPLAVLFRMVPKEMRRLGRVTSRAELEKLTATWAGENLRWQVIRARFCPADGTEKNPRA